MKVNKNIKVLIACLIVIICVGVFFQLCQKKERNNFYPNDYIFMGFGGDTDPQHILYPNIFDQLRIESNGNLISLGPTKQGDFEIYAQAKKGAKKDIEESKSFYLERGWIKEGNLKTMNGYDGELISSDQKAHPEPNTESCSFSYYYVVPLADGVNAVSLEISMTQPDFATMIGESKVSCRLYKDKNYNYYKNIINRMIGNLQTSN